MERTYRLIAWVVLVAAAQAQESNPFRTKTKELQGPTARVTITVPESWRPQPPSGNVVLRALAPGAYGGHDLLIVREEGQADVDRQRDRYMDHDGGRHAGAAFQKLTKPVFGYRLDDAVKNQVLLRTFVTDGGDGLVITVSSRYKLYDQYWARQIMAVVASLKLTGGGTARQPELGGEKRRVFDRTGLVSLVAPGVWRSLETEAEEELLFLGLKGTRSGPHVRIVDWGGPTNAALVLQKIAGQWKRAYGNITRKRLGLDPPALLVKNRKEGWVDYIIAFAAGGRGYTLMLAVREGSFERFKVLADEMAQTVVFMNGSYRPAPEMPGDITVEHKKAAVIHARAEEGVAAEKIAKAFAGFERPWSRLRLSRPLKTPLHLVLVDAESFDDASHGFGEKPAAYDRSLCAVVTVRPPSLKGNVPLWRGRLYAALAEAALHRDLKTSVPPWLLAGLTGCMEAAGRTGKGPDEGHPALVKLLDLKTSTDAHMPLKQVLALTYADMRADPEHPTMAWGYTHLMLFGGGTLTGLYRKWAKALGKARGEPPPFDLKKYDRAEGDLKRHVYKHWGK
ncbi:MAG: hypothetical protein ACYTEZ_18925 [Planctomycetota bacterium]|jgi:hypothetical protein